MAKWISAILTIALALSLAECQPRGDFSPAASATSAPTSDPSAISGPDMVSITFYREGEGTTLSVPMVDGTNGMYRIATNPELFRQEASGSSDVFWYTLWEGQPNIYYSISHHPDMTAEFMADGLLRQNDGATSEKAKIGQYDAIAVYASKNDNFLTQQHFYLIPHGSGCYMIETQFLFEMYEGLFPQMRAFFDTFVIIE